MSDMLDIVPESAGVLTPKQFKKAKRHIKSVIARAAYRSADHQLIRDHMPEFRRNEQRAYGNLERNLEPIEYSTERLLEWGRRHANQLHRNRVHYTARSAAKQTLRKKYPKEHEVFKEDVMERITTKNLHHHWDHIIRRISDGAF